MKKKLLLALIAIFTFGYYNVASAQSFGIYGALSIPTGDFADKNNGGAKLGYGGGLQFTSPLSSSPASEVALICDASILFNPVDASAIESVLGTSVTAGNWMNIPVMGGLRVSGVLSPDFSIYGMGLLGVNFVKAPTFEAQGVKVENDMATSFGFGFGAGAIFSERFNIGARYLILGEPEITTKATSATSGASMSGTFKQKISMLLITAGISF